MYLVINKSAFSEWLQNEMNERRISQSELARLSGLNRAIISKVVNSETEPTVNTIEALARGLGLPPEHVFLAVISVQAHESDPLASEAAHLVGLLPEEQKQIAVDYIRFLLEMEEKRRGKK